MKRRVHYVLSTHWDREWHQTFQDFRYRLVQLLDRVIDGWETGRLQGPFQTDGQAILLEDYLEVRPERREKVAALARAGQFVIGPWYVLPDEFAVSGEALIRNLRLGREIARSFGAQPSAAGFVCDCFGHISQLPQIFAGFGIQGGFIWRGTNTQGRRNLLWQGADGTLLPCVRFGAIGYCDYAVQVRQAGDHSTAAPESECFQARFERYLEAEAQATDVAPILAFDGCDHQAWDQETYALLLARVQEGDERFEIVHTSLDAYLAEMTPQQARIRARLEGELREPGRETRQPGQDPRAMDSQYVIPGVFSSRVQLKQANSLCQTLLCQWAEPFSAFASAALDLEYPQGFLNLAWRWLLQNHPHDSIDGCSIDQVHQDMVYRFDQSRLIGQRLTAEATQRIAASIAGELSEQELRVVVFNPLPRELEQVVELDLRIPTGWPKFNEFFGYEPKPAFRLYDQGGQELPYQRLGQDMGRKTFRLHGTRFPETVEYHAVKVALPLSLPALGYTTLHVRAGHEGEYTRHAAAPGLATSECAMANTYLEVEIAPNGTLTVTDKHTGQVYRRLLTFEDAADIGDGWYHGVAVNDQVFVSSGCPAQVALVHDSPLLTTFRVRTTMSVPRAFDFQRMRRADDGVDLVIDSLVTLRQEQNVVEVNTTVHNAAQDHRLRVLLPSGARAETYLADSPFDVVERAIPLREDNHLYRELEVETKPQGSWTAVYDERRGLAVVGDGLLETAVRDLPERPIALTLFRATGRTVGTDGEPGGQMQGHLTFDYWLVPLDGEPDRTRLCELGQRIAAGLQVAQLRPADVAIYRTGRTLPASAGLLRLEGAAILTSLRQVDGALELRLFNPLEAPVTATLDTARWPEGAQRPRYVGRVDLESNPLEAPRKLEAQTSFTLRAKEIVTYRLDQSGDWSSLGE
jgi:alpha-mannosidase